LREPSETAVFRAVGLVIEALRRVKKRSLFKSPIADSILAAGHNEV
jgi:hypothetical protein